jgi:hypothetical protein
MNETVNIYFGCKYTLTKSNKKKKKRTYVKAFEIVIFGKGIGRG